MSTIPGPKLDRGNWMQTFTGRQFHPLDPRAEDIDPVDIAHALSLICRYGGHARRFYSVAEHCVLMSHVVPEEHALWALLHDAAEAYVGDMVRPLKRMMPTYQVAEARVLEAIVHRFDLPVHGDDFFSDEVREADNRILLDERDALFGYTPAPWGVEDLGRLGVAINGHAPEMAEYLYAERLIELTGGGR